VCLFYQQGRCVKAELCPFLHTDAPALSTGDALPRSKKFSKETSAPPRSLREAALLARNSSRAHGAGMDVDDATDAPDAGAAGLDMEAAPIDAGWHQQSRGAFTFDSAIPEAAEGESVCAKLVVGRNKPLTSAGEGATQLRPVSAADKLRAAASSATLGNAAGRKAAIVTGRHKGAARAEEKPAAPSAAALLEEPANAAQPAAARATSMVGKALEAAAASVANKKKPGSATAGETHYCCCCCGDYRRMGREATSPRHGNQDCAGRGVHAASTPPALHSRRRCNVIWVMEGVATEGRQAATPWHASRPPWLAPTSRRLASRSPP
jgi:hypothetical protein